MSVGREPEINTMQTTKQELATILIEDTEILKYIWQT
jgi:hypothetical protein